MSERDGRRASARWRWARRLLAFGALAWLGVLLGVRGDARTAAPAAPPARRVAARSPRAEPRPAPPPIPAPQPAPPAPAQNRPPRLTSAALDRTHLCAGEASFLRMSAEDPDDGDLRYRVTWLSPALATPRFAFGRWIRIEAPATPGRYPLIAVVEDPGRARDEVPLELVVDDCAAPPPFDASQLRIGHAELDALVHELDLDAARARAQRAGKPLSVERWSFGDGETQVGGLRARHRYPVVLDRRYSYYLVQADVRVDGVPARLEYGLTSYSYAGANLQAGYVALAADVERGDDRRDTIRYVVTFSNLTPFSAWARELQLTCLDAAGLPQSRWREPLDLTVPGDTSLEQTLELERARCPGGALYEVFGEADGGYAVGGLWSYRLRPSAAVKDVRAARERARRVLLQPAAAETPPR